MKYLKSYILFESRTNNTRIYFHYKWSDWKTKKSTPTTDKIPLEGQTINNIIIVDGKKENHIIYLIADNRFYRIYQYDKCCSNSHVIKLSNEDILIGSKIIKAEATSECTLVDGNDEEGEVKNRYDNYVTFTFETGKGVYDILWIAEEPGCDSSSDSPSFEEIYPKDFLPFLKDKSQDIIELFDDYDVIQNGQIITNRLSDFLREIGLKQEEEELDLEYLLKHSKL